jgi:hypothetical protein
VKHIVAHPLRLLNGAFMLIAEPRVERVLQFGIYALMGYGGAWILVAPPETFSDALPEFNLVIFGLFAVVGSTFGMVAVLPGIWWLERVGIASLIVGLLIYWALGIAIGSSTFVAVMTLAFALKFAQRWGRIRGAALAPKKVRPVGVEG